MSVEKKKTRVGLLGAVDKALWRAIDDGKDTTLLYVRMGGKRDVRVTVTLDPGLGDTKHTEVLIEGEDDV